MTYPAEVRRRMYALMVLTKAADDRLSKGIGTGEFMCVYWPSRGQEAIGAAMGVSLRRDDQLVTTYRGYMTSSAKAFRSKRSTAR